MSARAIVQRIEASLQVLLGFIERAEPGERVTVSQYEWSKVMAEAAVHAPRALQELVRHRPTVQAEMVEDALTAFFDAQSGTATAWAGWARVKRETPKEADMLRYAMTAALWAVLPRDGDAEPVEAPQISTPGVLFRSLDGRPH